MAHRDAGTHLGRFAAGATASCGRGHKDRCGWRIRRLSAAAARGCHCAQASRYRRPTRQRATQPIRCGPRAQRRRPGADPGQRAPAIVDNTPGLVRLVADRDSGRLLGVTAAVGGQAGPCLGAGSGPARMASRGGRSATPPDQSPRQRCLRPGSPSVRAAARYTAGLTLASDSGVHPEWLVFVAGLSPLRLVRLVVVWPPQVHRHHPGVEQVEAVEEPQHLGMGS